MFSKASTKERAGKGKLKHVSKKMMLKVHLKLTPAPPQLSAK